jgi:DHA1 family bicyclomycin/chloramphenicol resistance-like MFS transporter
MAITTVSQNGRLRDRLRSRARSGTLEPSPPETRRAALALFLVLGAASVYGPATMDANLPALPTVAHDFGATASATQLTITSYLVGIAIGQLLIGSLSDVYGRRRPFVFGLLGYVGVSLLCAAAPSLSVLIALRLLQGVGSAAGVVTTRAIVRDLYDGPRAAAYLSRLTLLIGAAPVLAPTVGAQLLRVTSWRGIFVALAAFVLVVLAATALLVPETLPPERRRPPGLRSMGGGLVQLLHVRDFVGFALTVGFSSAIVAVYVAGATFVLQGRFGLSPEQFGLVFAANAAGMIAVGQLNAYVVHRFPVDRVLGIALGANVVAGAAFLAVALLDLGLAPTLVCLFALFAAWGAIPANATALGLASHPHRAASAAALLGLFQFGIGSLLAPIAGVAGGVSAVPMAATILGCAAAALFSLRVVARPHRVRAAPPPLHPSAIGE